MRNEPRAHKEDCTNIPDAIEEALTDDEVLAFYARLHEPLAGRSGREFQFSDWPDLKKHLPVEALSKPYTEEVLSRIHLPEAVLMLADLAFGRRVSKLAKELGVDDNALAITLKRAREIVRGSLEEHKMEAGSVAAPPRSSADKEAATTALGVIDEMRSALVKRTNEGLPICTDQALQEQNDSSAQPLDSPEEAHIQIVFPSSKEVVINKVSMQGEVVTTATIRGPSRTQLFRLVATAAGRSLTWREILKALMEEDGRARTGTDTLRRAGNRIKMDLKEFGCFWHQNSTGVTWDPDIPAFIS